MLKQSKTVYQKSLPFETGVSNLTVIMNFNSSRYSPRSYFTSFFNSQLWHSMTNFTAWKVLHYVIMVIFCTCSWITKMKGIPLRQLYLLSWINLIIWCISDYVYPQKLQESDIKPTQWCCIENVIKKKGFRTST